MELLKEPFIAIIRGPFTSKRGLQNVSIRRTDRSVLVPSGAEAWLFLVVDPQARSCPQVVFAFVGAPAGRMVPVDTKGLQEDVFSGRAYDGRWGHVPDRKRHV